MGRAMNFIGNIHFRYEIITVTCTVDQWQYKYKLKSESDVLATPLVGHLKKSKPILRSRQRRKEKPKTSNITSYRGSQSQGKSSVTVGKQPAIMLKYTITSQNVKDMAVEAVTTNGLFRCI